MAIPTIESTPIDEAARRAAQRRLAQLNADNTPESLNAVTSTLAGAAAPRPSLGGQPSVLDQSQRAGERTPFRPSASMIEEMERATATSAAQNAAYKNRDLATGAAGARPTSGTSQSTDSPLGAAVRRRLGVPDRSPLGPVGPLGPQGPKPGESMSGPTPIDETHRRGERGQTLIPTGPAGSVGPIGPLGPTGLAGPGPTGNMSAPRSLDAPLPIDPAHRAGERSPVPYDMDALRLEAQRRADAANAGNAASSGTTTTTSGSIVRPPQPPTQPPQPPTDTTTDRLLDDPRDSRLSGLFDQMMQGFNQQTGDTIDGIGTGAGTGAGTSPGRGLIDQSGGGSAGSTAQLQQALASDLNEISAILSRGANAPDMMAIFATQGRTVLAMLDEQIREMQLEGENIDPATANTLATMREELDRQLKANLEFMNARGIAESGITIEAQSILRKGNMSDQAKILAERLSRIQNNIQQLRGQKSTEASRFGLAGANAQTQAELAERNRLDDLRGLRQQGRTTLLNNQTQIEEAQRSRDFEAEQSQLQRQLAIATKNAELAARVQDRESEQAWRSQEAALDRELQQSLSAQVTARSGGTARSSGGTVRSSGGTANGATPEDNTQSAIDDLFNTFVTRREAEAALSDPAIIRELQAHGVDIGAVIDAAQGLGERRAGTADY